MVSQISQLTSLSDCRTWTEEPRLARAVRGDGPGRPGGKTLGDNNMLISGLRAARNWGTEELDWVTNTIQHMSIPDRFIIHRNNWTRKNYLQHSSMSCFAPDWFTLTLLDCYSFQLGRGGERSRCCLGLNWTTNVGVTRWRSRNWKLNEAEYRARSVPTKLGFSCSHY